MSDPKTSRLVIAFLGLLALATVVGGIVLAWNDRSLPGEIIAIGSAAAGAIGGILSNAARSDKPTPVQVVNEPHDSVPVEETTAATRKRRSVTGGN